MAILVSNLPTQTTEADLNKLFVPHAQISAITIAEDNTAVVEIAADTDINIEDRVIAALNGAEIYGQNIQLAQIFLPQNFSAVPPPGETEGPPPPPPIFKQTSSTTGETGGPNPPPPK